MEVTTIIWMIMLGAAVATLSVYYNSRFLGRFVRALINIDATSPESALTLKELGVKMTPPLKNALQPGKSLTQIVVKTEDGRYFIKPEKISFAKAKYRTKDTTVLFVLMSLIIILVATLALTYIFPDVIQGFNEQMTQMFGSEG